VDSQRADRGSTLWLYKQVLGLRRESPALRSGRFRWLDSAPDVLAYERTEGDDRRVILVNQGATPAAVRLEGEWQVDLASDGVSTPAALAGDAAVLLRPVSAASRGRPR
jgi:glycosidase